MSKLGILFAAGVGYVVGTRDGRERYEQIKQQAQKFWKNPKVQETKEHATEAAKQKGSELQNKASGKVNKRKQKQTDSSPRSDFSSGSDSSSSSPSGTSPGFPSMPSTTNTPGTTGTNGSSSGPKHA